jgi:hypothetical protein
MVRQQKHAWTAVDGVFATIQATLVVVGIVHLH